MTKYIEVTTKDSEDVYYVPRKKLKEKRRAVQKVTSLLTPIIGETVDVFKQNEKDQVKAAIKANAVGIENVDEPDMDLFSIMQMIGVQLDNPQVEEIQDILIKGVRVSKGGPSQKSIDSLPEYDLDEEEDLSLYYKLVKVSFDENVMIPFLKCLDDMGFSEIVGNVQAQLVSKFSGLTPSNS